MASPFSKFQRWNVLTGVGSSHHQSSSSLFLSAAGIFCVRFWVFGRPIASGLRSGQVFEKVAPVCSRANFSNTCCERLSLTGQLWRGLLNNELRGPLM